jgi:hypothetical protein
MILDCRLRIEKTEVIRNKSGLYLIQLVEQTMHRRDSYPLSSPFRIPHSKFPTTQPYFPKYSRANTRKRLFSSSVPGVMRK